MLVLIVMTFLPFLVSIMAMRRCYHVIVLDNAKIYRTETIVKWLETNCITYIILPPYSPDYNAIEWVFALLKGKLLHRVGADVDFVDPCVMFDILKWRCPLDKKLLFLMSHPHTQSFVIWKSSSITIQATISIGVVVVGCWWWLRRFCFRLEHKPHKIPHPFLFSDNICQFFQWLLSIPWIQTWYLESMR